MEKPTQIYTQFGDYIQLHVQSVNGNMASQGFQNPNIYCQIIPKKHYDCFTRNKRDFMWQIIPKLNFDARRDFESQKQIYDKLYGDQPDPDDQTNQEKDIQADDENLDGSNAEDNVSQTSFFQQGNKPDTKKMSQASRKDKEEFIKKLQGLDKKINEENRQNDKNLMMRKGDYVEYGNEVQLLHVDSGCYLSGQKGCADEDNSCNKVELSTHGSRAVYFKALGGFKYKQEGDRIHYNDQIVLLNLEFNLFLNVTEKLLKVEGLDGGQIPESLRVGVDIITPKFIDRRVPPSLYSPYCEVNLSQGKSKFQVIIYRYFDEDPDNQFIKGGSVVRLLHSERGGYIHSDDKDFTDDGLAEVYLWNFKGKQNDFEAMSSSSLFELELAGPLPKSNNKHDESQTPSEINGEQMEQEVEPKSNLENRVGRVFNYSVSGGIAKAQQAEDQAHYRLRHLATGRLVIDQDINYNGVQLKTLGLSPHIIARNLDKLSDKQCEPARKDLESFDTDLNLTVENFTEGTPQTYRELDLRSRFSIVSTSPSLDMRIRANSCVQIQHVATEMYLSYESKSTFKKDKALKNNVGVSGFNEEDQKLIKEIEANQKQANKNKKSARPVDSNQVTEGQEGTGDSEALYHPVDDDDIQIGTRDAIELKPHNSNEDAFFIMPEKQQALQNILFIQTAIDLLKKYLSTVCSVNLDLSKEKSRKVLDNLDKITEFLLGDTKENFLAGEKRVATGFSKDENDMQVKQLINLMMRQKLMRELYTVESLVQTIYLPFVYGDFNLEEIRTGDKIADVCLKSYNLIKLIALGYYQNELYVSQWLNLYFLHAMATNHLNNIGAEDTIISLVDNNKKLLEIQITPLIIEKFINLCKVQKRERKLIQLLKAICSCGEEPIVNNQNSIAEILLEDDQSRTMLMMPIRLKTNDMIDVLLDADQSMGNWMPLTNYRAFKRKNYGYFLSLIDLSAELCIGRNSRSIETLQEMYSFDTVQSLVKNKQLPFEMRALFMRILLHLHMDREPLQPIQIPQQTGVWNDLAPFIKEQFIDPSSFNYPISQSRIQVPNALVAIKKFVEIYLIETNGIQNIFEIGKNMMTFEILKIIRFMLNHGFYASLKELKGVALPMINLLNGANDIYVKMDEQEGDLSMDDFLSSKRYFSSGSNDIIIQCKALICQNLLIVSQLEIDGKVMVFLSKFKSDLDMLNFHKKSQASKRSDEEKGINAEMEQQVKRAWGCFKRGFSALNFNPGQVVNNFLDFKQIERQNIEFLDEIANSYNFEAENRDSYICTLFDLLLYKYPALAKGVFELLVRLFTRKRTLLENLMGIQMLENPRSIRILSKLQSYYLELKKFIDDADQWLNKTNAASKTAKYRVTQIFEFFSKICQEQKKKDEMGGDMQGVEGIQPPGDGEESKKDQPPQTDQQPSLSKVSQKDFLLFHRIDSPVNTENQRLLGNFGIENLAIFFLKYRVERNSVNDPFYQKLIHECYTFLMNYVRQNFQNQVKVHDNLEIFLRDIDKNPQICLLLYEMFKDNKKFLTLNVQKILRQIILNAEEASLDSSKKALYLKLLEVFCKFEDKVVRPNQQEIIITFTRDISKNNLIYLFSDEGLSHLIKHLQRCVSQPEPQKKDGELQQIVSSLTEDQKEPVQNLSIEVFNVQVCLDLLGVCCEGKSDLAEEKCQKDIVNLQTAYTLYDKSLNLWPFKKCLVNYITNVYMDTANITLFAKNRGQTNLNTMSELLKLIRDDMVKIHEDWEQEYSKPNLKIKFPDGTMSDFLTEAKIYAMDYITVFLRNLLKNRNIEMPLEIFPTYHDITEKIAKMYYMVDNKMEYQSNFAFNAMEVLSFINTSEKYAVLLEGVQHPANQNIYLNSKKMVGLDSGGESASKDEQKSHQLTQKLIHLGFSEEMQEQKEREFEELVLWVCNIEKRISVIMKKVADAKNEVFNPTSFDNVKYSPILSSFMTLLDSKCMAKDLHITGLTLLRKIIEVENKQMTTPASDWDGEDWLDYQKVILSKQNSLVQIGTIEFLCKHMQEIDDDDILEAILLVCITLLIGGNRASQDNFYNYFLLQDQDNIIMMKVKRLLVEQFDLTKKFISEKNAKLAMIYKNKQRQEQINEEKRALEAEEAAHGHSHSHAHGAPPKEPSEEENLLTIEESQADDEEGGGGDDGGGDGSGGDIVASQTPAITKCQRLLRFIQLLTEGHHTNLQNFMREQVMLNGDVNMQSFDFISYLSQMMAMYEKQYLNCYTTNFGLQLIDTLIEAVQGPCKQNQKQLVEAKIIDCCRDLVQQGQQSKSELQMRGFTNEAKEEMHDSLKMSAVKLLLSLIEGSVDKSIYQQISDSLDDFTILMKRMETIFDRFVTEKLGLDSLAPLEKIQASLNKDSLKDEIIEGFDIFILINQLQVALPRVADLTVQWKELTMYQFFAHNTGNVEVIKDDEVMTIYFPIQPVAWFLTEQTKNVFDRTVDRESSQHKILDLISRMPAFLDEMQHLEERSHDFIQITPERLTYLKDASTLIAISVSTICMIFYKYIRVERSDGSVDYMAAIPAIPAKIMIYLGYIQLCSSLTLLIGFCQNRINIIVKSGWRKKTDANRELMMYEINTILTPCEPPFGELCATNMPIQACRVLLLTEGPYHRAFWQDGKYNFGYKAVEFEYKWVSLSFLMQDGDFIFNIIYLVNSLQGLYQSPVFYSVHLLDVINRFPQLKTVIRSVTVNGKQLVMTAMLGFIIIYIYSAIGFIFLYDTFYDDFIHAGLLNRKGDSICMTMMHCFLSTVNYGVRGGGGIGEFLPTQTAVPENAQGFYFRSLYDLSFFLLVITILLNIIFGIIIDTFAQLRDIDIAIITDTKNTCFICGIDKAVFDKDTEQGFEYHQEMDHNVWKYLYFIIHLKEIDPTDLNGTESYILDMFESENINWFPIQQSQRININKEQKEAVKLAKKLAAEGPLEGEEKGPISSKDPMISIPSNIENIQENVTAFITKFA